MSKHSPEPWGLWPIGDQNVEIVSLAGGKREPLGILCKFYLPEEMDNTTRLVDCVNACRDLVDPHAVQDLLSSLKAVISVADRNAKEFEAAKTAIARAEGHGNE